jgi:hypothetical protein
MYYIYSPEKHKVYRVSVARVEDSEGLDDLYDAPCLEDRIPTPSIKALSNISSEDKNEPSSDSDSDQIKDGYPANMLRIHTEQIN